MRTSSSSSVAALITAFALLQRSFAQNVTTESVGLSFTQAKIVPDVLPSFAPTGVLEVIFTDPSNSNRTQVTPGMNLTVSQTSSLPTFGISGLPPSFAPQTFAVVLIDPDAPTPQSPSAAQFLHFLGGDFEIRGEAVETTPALTNQSQAAMEYTGPNPPAGSPPHRYVLLVYNQNTLPTADTTFGAAAAPFVNASTSRANFNVTRFAEQTMITGPVAGTFFYVAPDSPAPSSSSLPATGTAASDSATTSTSNSATTNGLVSQGLAALVALVLLAFCSV